MESIHHSGRTTQRRVLNGNVMGPWSEPKTGTFTCWPILPEPMLLTSLPFANHMVYVVYLERNRYGIPSFLSISEKVSLSTEILIPPLDSPMPTLSISFTSAASIPLALPPVIARGFGWPKWGLGFEGVNDLVGKWLLAQLNSDKAIRQRESADRECQRYTLMEADNAKLASYTDPGPRIRGWVLMDYYEDPIGAGVVPLFVECNFRGRRRGEEGW